MSHGPNLSLFDNYLNNKLMKQKENSLTCIDSNSMIQTKIPDKLIRQHNDITFASYGMTAMQKDIVYMLLSAIKQNDPSDMIYKFHISALVNRNRLGRINANDIAESIKGLIKREIIIKKPDSVLIFPAVFSSIRIIESGVMEMMIDKRLIPYIQNLRKNFTTFRVKTALAIKGVHTKRIYEMINAFKDTGYMIMNLNELKFKLGLIDSNIGRESYYKFAKFRIGVLDKAQKELVDLDADIKFSYKPILVGRKYSKIEFHIYKKNIEFKQLGSNVVVDDNVRCMTKLIDEFKLSKWQAVLILENVAVKEVMKLLYEIKLQKINNRVRNIGGYTFKIFQNQYPILDKITL